MKKENIIKTLNQLELESLYAVRDEVNKIIGQKRKKINMNSKVLIESIPMSNELRNLLQQNRIKNMDELIIKGENNISGIGSITKEELNFIIRMYNFNNIDKNNSKKLDKKI